MRIMGLDFGSRTVGVAISDSLLLTAQGVEIIRRKEENKLRQTLARIEELIVENEVDEIVLGLPKNMNDTEGVRVELTKEFKEKLEAIATNAVGDACTGSNPRPIDPATMAKLFTCIYYGTEVDF